MSSFEEIYFEYCLVSNNALGYIQEIMTYNVYV